MPKQITVYFNGSGRPMPRVVSEYLHGVDPDFNTPRITLADLLCDLSVTDAAHSVIRVAGFASESDDWRDLGIFFSFSLESQVQKVVDQIEDIIYSDDEPTTLNIYGFSRGGVAAFLLAKKLKHIRPVDLAINIVAIEPVSGNLVTTSTLDFALGMNQTLSSATVDLSDCENLQNVLVLLTHQPTPSVICLAPVLPVFPAHCQLTVDVVPGSHMSAVTYYDRGHHITPKNDESMITFHRVVEFLRRFGTQFDAERRHLADSLIVGPLTDERKTQLCSAYARLTTKLTALQGVTQRSMHFGNSIFARHDRVMYLNSYHQLLIDPALIDRRTCLLSVADIRPAASNLPNAGMAASMRRVWSLAASVRERIAGAPSIEDAAYFQLR